MSKAKHALTFRIFQNGQFLREDTLTAGVIKIGKVPSAHVRIDDDSVSRMHAVLEVNPHDVSLIDLGSTRGTFVNGKKINKARLQTGDVLQLGDVRIELTIAPQAERSGAVVAVTASADGAGMAASVATPAARMPPPLPVSNANGTPPLPVVATVSPTAGPSLRSVPSFTPAPPLLRPDATPPRAFPLVARPLAADADDLEPDRAVEVAAMLGDSVLDVKHCLDPHSGKIRRATWGLLAAGAICLATAGASFIASVHTSAVNEAARDRWVRVQHRPAHAFRPITTSAGLDWLAFGGLALGLASVAMSVWRMRGERATPYYRIGTAPGVELAVAQVPAAAFPLVAPSGDGFVLTYGGGIDGELTLDGVTTPLSAIAGRPSAAVAGAVELPIPPRARIRARAGQATFLVTSVPRPRRAAAPLLAHLERRALTYFGGSLAVHLAILGLLSLIPPEAEMASLESPIDEGTTIRTDGTTHLDPNPDRQPDRDQVGDQAGDNPKAGSMALPGQEGAAGDPSQTAQARMQVAHRSELEPANLRDARLEAEKAGVLGSDRLMSAVAVLGAHSDYANAFDLDDIAGSIGGPEGPGGAGNFGGGVHGNGPGGGCGYGPCGTIASAGYNKIGIGGRDGTGFTLGSHGNLPGRGHIATPPTVGTPVISDTTYDKSIVRRYIRQHISEITYCYEKQLLAHPTIGGDIKVQFLIAPNGAVQSAAGEGFDGEVASCLAGVIKTIAFPGPGGAVQVNYPFHFHAPGA